MAAGGPAGAHLCLPSHHAGPGHCLLYPLRSSSQEPERHPVLPVGDQHLRKNGPSPLVRALPAGYLPNQRLNQGPALGADALLPGQVAQTERTPQLIAGQRANAKECPLPSSTSGTVCQDAETHLEGH